MTQKDFIGKKHHQLLTWLRDTWIPTGSPVCFLEGFPGVGKSNLARKLAATTSVPVVSLEIPDSSTVSLDDLLLNLAQAWSDTGNNELADTIAAGKSPLPTLARLLQNPVLIVMDEFQNAMTGEQAKLSGPLADLFQRLSQNPQAKGRILLLTNRLVERERWSEAYEKKSLAGLDAEDGAAFLDQMLTEAERGDEVPPESRASVVHWLGGNPRALSLLVASLKYSPLEELVGINLETWEYPELLVSPELIQKIERQMLERILGKLGDEFRHGLYQLSVFRKSFKNKALELLFPEKETLSHFKGELINQFLMEQHSGWYSLHPIVREIGLQKLLGNPSDLKKAHVQAARHYTRHFYATDKDKQLGTLGGYFTEARYHLIQAGDQKVLAQIAQHFLDHLAASFTVSTQVPKEQEVLNERIAVLAAVLETPGPRGLEYHLTRLYDARRQAGDLEKAIRHIRRTIGPKATMDSWVLAGKLLAQNNQINEAIALLREGIGMVPAEKSLFSLFQFSAELLSLNRQWKDAAVLLWEGLEKVPAQFNRIKLTYGLLTQEAAVGNEVGLHAVAARMETSERLAVVLATCFLKQVAQGWEAAAIAIAQGQDSRHSNMFLLIEEAFCWLGAGKPDKAKQTFERFSIPVLYHKNQANTWLMAFIKYQSGDLVGARQNLSIYLGDNWTGPDAGMHAMLLSLWDEADTPWGRGDLAFYFPILPAALSGLPHAVRRQLYAPPVLPTHLKTIPESSSPPAMTEPNPAAQMLQDKRARSAFDVFLCHNNADKNAVKKIGEHLKQFGLLPWLDEWELEPGESLQTALSKQIEGIRSAAVFVGPDGIAPWQNVEMEAFINEFVKRGIKVIPVILPECKEEPKLPVLLGTLHFVDFRKNDPNPYHQLVWGITRKKPEDLEAGILSQSVELLTSPSLLEEIRMVVKSELVRSNSMLIQQSERHLEIMLQSLSESQKAIVQTLSQGIESSRFSEQEMQTLLSAIQEIKSNPANSPEVSEAVQKLPDVFEDSKMGVTHKLKLMLPIVPFFLNYETEITLSSGLNFSTLIDNMLSKMRGAK